MKRIPILAVCGSLVLAAAGMAAPAAARPGHHAHRPVCSTTWVHHHKVRRCR